MRLNLSKTTYVSFQLIAEETASLVFLESQPHAFPQVYNPQFSYVSVEETQMYLKGVFKFDYLT